MTYSKEPPTDRPPTDRPRPDRVALPPPLHDDPTLVVTPEVLARHNARVLDPTTATTVAGQPPIRTTVYIGNKLIVNAGADAATLDALEQAAAANGVVVVREPLRVTRLAELADVARNADHPDAETLFPVLIELVPAPGQAVAVDAWPVLQTFRAILGDDTGAQAMVGLDHLLTAAPHISGSPFAPVGDQPSSSYGRPGAGGRVPVNWQGPMPPRDPDFDGRRPVVAVLDTGCGLHAWFRQGVTRNAAFAGMALGLHDPAGDPEASGGHDDPLEGVLDSDAGHGTFIAGLVRQSCPDAEILAIRVMASDGAVAEHVLIESLTLLALRQRKAQNDGDEFGIIDVVSLSLGYYHEQAGDALADQPILTPLIALAELGVAVVVAAGNDSTTRPMFPAAFYPHPGGVVSVFDPAVVPVISVGARNPNDTIALFSNAGNWVTCHRPGANLVSTFPPLDGSEQPDYVIGNRATIDPDDYTGGFGIWSGTSFAAPLVAGDIAQILIGEGTLGSIDAASSVARAWTAVAAATGVSLA